MFTQYKNQAAKVLYQKLILENNMVEKGKVTFLVLPLMLRNAIDRKIAVDAHGGALFRSRMGRGLSCDQLFSGALEDQGGQEVQ